MQDPSPENITGSKQHVFKHEVNWSHMALAIVAIFAIVRLSGVLQGKDEDDGLVTTQ